MNQKPLDAKMKTLVKYLPKDKLLSVCCKPFRSFQLPVSRLIAEGMGDHTVQEDGKTVYIVQTQYMRLR